VFGVSTAKLVEVASRKFGLPQLTIPCRGVLAGGRPIVEVIGPALQAEALVAHNGYWT
jgi:hypothetical protein